MICFRSRGPISRASTAGTALLLSDMILNVRPFDTNSNKWNGSDVQKWLNSGFDDTAFSKSDKAAICDNAEGKVRLPSRGELTDTSYGFSSNPYTNDSMRCASYAYGQNLWNVADSDDTSYFASTPPQ